MTRARRTPLVALALALAAPGARAAADPPDGSEPPGSVAPPAGDEPGRREWLAAVAAADPDSYAGGSPTADLVDGNRVIMIGDSIMASTSSRYGGESCDRLVPLGWSVEVDAEAGRFVDFGTRVLDARLDGDFDVGVVMLGNNYGADRGIFEDHLRDVVERLAPRPTVLYTVTMYRPDRAEVNEVVYDVAADHDNVRVIDWATETEEAPELVGPDRLHLSDAGRARFADLLGDELGPGPFGRGADQGECLRSPFTDDSAVAAGATTVPGQAPPPPSVTRPAPAPAPQPTVGVTEPPAPPPVETQPPGPEPTAPQPTDPPPTPPPPTPPPPTAPPPPPPTTAPAVPQPTTP